MCIDFLREKLLQRTMKMNKILIIGKNSYIGCSFKKWMEKYGKMVKVECISSRNHDWEKVDFGKYDTILHVAGIAHVNASADREKEYYKVNRDLTISCCKKAKEDGAKQFIFLSSIIVFGESKSLKPIRITKNTQPSPNGFYGKSKLEAEQGILPMATDTFRVAVVRPPMVYGKGSKGNYARLSKLAKKLSVFPKYSNQRSMIHIDILCECLRLIIENQAEGIFCPQNREYVTTSEMIKEIGFCYGRNVYLVPFLGGMIKIAAKFVPLLNKVFGSLTYEKSLSNCFGGAYQILDFKETIQRTEEKG